jgi:hypothetical protein
VPSAARRAATQLMPGQYSRGPPVTKAQRGKPSLVAREAGTGGGSSEEAEVIWATGRTRAHEDGPPSLACYHPFSATARTHGTRCLLGMAYRASLVGLLLQARINFEL